VPALIELQLEVMLTRDAEGRLIATRDPAPQTAPRLFLGRSADANVWAMRGDLEPALCSELERLCAAESRLALPRSDAPPACRARVLALLSPFVREHRGPAYVLPDGLPSDGRARVVTADERGLWAEAFPWLEAEFDAVTPVAIAFADGEPAAICHSPRGMTAAVAEAGVETREAFRGRGLATAAVACWARAVQCTGRRALYSTSWENAASQAIARKLSGRLYGENWHVT
jgi:hypothetical protein